MEEKMIYDVCPPTIHLRKGMKVMIGQAVFALLVILSGAPVCPAADTLAAEQIVDAAIRYYRGQSSAAIMDMKIVRPAWSRELSLKAWTKGQKNSLFTIISPPKDEGNGTLKKGDEMWTYNPKINRIIKLPPSMMSQSWMGSDFSNDDLAKSDSIVEDYVHRLIGAEFHEGKRVHVIQCTPKPGAAVVWGKQVLKIREDHILLLQEFYDEDNRLVKFLTGTQIEPVGGKVFPRFWTMQKGTDGRDFTTVAYREVRFDMEIPDDFFTRTSLTNAWR